MYRFLAFVGVSILVIASFSQAGCGNDARSMDSEGEDEEKTAVPVEVSMVIRGDISAHLVGTATLEAEDEATVVAKSGGIVAELFVEEGGYVRAGQKLAQLDDDRLSLELERAEASLQKLQREYARNEELHEMQLVSTEEYERVRSEYEAQKAARDLAQLNLQHTTVVAPISGVISERMIKIGNMVQAFEPTFRITDFDPLLAVMHVPERELQKLKVGQRATLRVDAFSDEQFIGRILRISPVLDPATGTFKVTVEVRDRSRRLKPGMFTRIRVVHDTHTGTLLVPKVAVVAEDMASSVFVVRDSMSFRQEVVTGYEDDTYVEVSEGIEEGATVITTGQTNLKDSSLVEIINEL